MDLGGSWDILSGLLVTDWLWEVRKKSEAWLADLCVHVVSLPACKGWQKASWSPRSYCLTPWATSLLSREVKLLSCQVCHQTEFDWVIAPMCHTWNRIPCSSFPFQINLAPDLPVSESLPWKGKHAYPASFRHDAFVHLLCWNLTVWPQSWTRACTQVKMICNSTDATQCCDVLAALGLEWMDYRRVWSVGMGTRSLLLRAVSLVLQQHLMHSWLQIPICWKREPLEFIF